MTKAILWDNDGVLVDTEQIYYEVTRDVLATVDVELTPPLYHDLFLLQGRGAWHLAEARGLPGHEVERLRDVRNTRYAQRLRDAPLLIDGVARVLQALHGRFTMGVVTSSRLDHFETIHETTGLLPYFDFILTASDVTRVKPDPELYLKAVERSGCRPEECLAIEDSERGLRAARLAGVPCVVVPTALTRGTTFEGAARVLRDAGELLDLLERDTAGEPARLTAHPSR
ncbi:MAG: HAD-IA family hydrolase [Acidobacteria bacterium]|nr:HAD-IA family hydrolase [Acidobacteriota bacterium]